MTLRLLNIEISNLLAAIADLLSEEYKLTLVARHINNPKASIIVGDDDEFGEVVETINNRDSMKVVDQT